ncbi:MAG: GYD domain-containing protein [Chloroflexota bacterium]|nr:GYD domain-containing protein [Chloroflexota bacterium]
MPLYLYEAAYTAESLVAQIKEPKDRIEVVTPLFDAARAKILAAGYPFGNYDVVVVYEAPDDTVAAGLALAIGAGGAVRSAKTTKLLSGQEWIASLKKAQGVSPQYRPAR